ncbi:MAG: type II toxin-antitoxin system MqsA family antitoxin [Gammaproteobacteria bacterium]
MKNTIKKSNCPLCGEKSYYRDTRPLVLEYKGHSITVQQPGFWCDACKEGVIEGPDLKATREELQAFHAKIDGLLSPERIHTIRKKILKISQQEAARTFGGGPNAFSRYERGEVAPSRALSHLLYILERHPEQFQELLR